MRNLKPNPSMFTSLKLPTKYKKRSIVQLNSLPDNYPVPTVDLTGNVKKKRSGFLSHLDGKRKPDDPRRGNLSASSVIDQLN